MNDAGRVVVVERRLTEVSGQSDPLNYLSEIEMLTLLRGRERTDAEYAALASASGLELERIVPADSPFALFEMRRK